MHAATGENNNFEMLLVICTVYKYTSINYLICVILRYYIVDGDVKYNCT